MRLGTRHGVETCVLSRLKLPMAWRRRGVEREPGNPLDIPRRPTRFT
jgi:hypothetical protein